MDRIPGMCHHNGWKRPLSYSGLEHTEGHAKGVEVVRKIMENAVELVSGVDALRVLNGELESS